MRYVILSLALVTAACGKKEEAPKPNPTTEAKAEPKPEAKPEPKPEPKAEPTPATAGAESPEKALALFYPALRKPEPEVLWSLTAEEARAQLTSILDKAKAGEMKIPEEFGLGAVDVATLTPKDLFVGIAKANAEKQKDRIAQDPTDAKFETVEEGKRAKANYKLGAAFCELHLVKEADGWKIVNEECNEGG